MANRRQTGWTEEEIIKGIQNFYNKNGEIPRNKYFNNENGLPTCFYAKNVLGCNTIKELIEKCNLQYNKKDVWNKTNADIVLQKMKELFKKINRLPNRQEIVEFDKISINVINRNGGIFKYFVDNNIVSEDYFHDKFISDLKEKNRYVYDNFIFKTKYENMHKKIILEDRYGELLVPPTSIMSGFKPNIKSAINKHEYYCNILKEKRPSLFSEIDFKSKYIDAMTYINIEIKGEKFSVRPDKLLSTFSPSNTKSSHEFKIENILNWFGIKYSTQKTFDDLINFDTGRKYKYDFYLPNHNLIIEADGRQHFEAIEVFGGEEEYVKRKISDEIKNKYCKTNDIRLLRIPYWEFNNGNYENILIKELNLDYEKEN